MVYRALRGCVCTPALLFPSVYADGSFAISILGREPLRWECDVLEGVGHKHCLVSACEGWGREAEGLGRENALALCLISLSIASVFLALLPSVSLFLTPIFSTPSFPTLIPSASPPPSLLSLPGCRSANYLMTLSKDLQTEILDLIYDKNKGLGLDVIRYSIPGSYESVRQSKTMVFKQVIRQGYVPSVPDNQGRPGHLGLQLGRRCGPAERDERGHEEGVTHVDAPPTAPLVAHCQR